MRHDDARTVGALFLDGRDIALLFFFFVAFNGSQRRQIALFHQKKKEATHVRTSMYICDTCSDTGKFFQQPGRRPTSLSYDRDNLPPSPPRVGLT